MAEGVKKGSCRFQTACAADFTSLRPPQNLGKPSRPISVARRLSPLPASLLGHRHVLAPHPSSAAQASNRHGRRLDLVPAECLQPEPLAGAGA
jgi:hypothetical protein